MTRINREMEEWTVVATAAAHTVDLVDNFKFLINAKILPREASQLSIMMELHVAARMQFRKAPLLRVQEGFKSRSPSCSFSVGYDKYFTSLTNDIELQLLLKDANISREVHLYSENTSEGNKVGEDTGLHDVVIEEIVVESEIEGNSKKQRAKKKREGVRRGKRPVDVIEVDDDEGDDDECRDSDYEEVETHLDAGFTEYCNSIVPNIEKEANILQNEHKRDRMNTGVTS